MQRDFQRRNYVDRDSDMIDKIEKQYDSSIQWQTPSWVTDKFVLSSYSNTTDTFGLFDTYTANLNILSSHSSVVDIRSNLDSKQSG